MATNDVTIRLNAQDKASPSINQVKQSLTGLVSAQGVMGGIVGGLIGGGMMGLANAAMQAAAAIPQAVGAMVNAAGQIEVVKASFDSLAASAGQSGESMLESMRMASRGMVADYDLILGANKAMLLGVADTGDELAALIDVARIRGQAMGLSLTQAFDNIVTGLGRESALILDNLGITLNVDNVMKEYADTLGKTVTALSAVERKQALVNAVMASTPASVGTAGIGLASAQQQAAAAQANAEAAAGAFFAPIVREVEQGKAQLFQSLTGTYDEFAAKISNINDILADAAGDSSISAEWTTRFTELQSALSLVGTALAAGVPGAEDYATAIGNIAAKASATRQITDQQAGSIAMIVHQVTLATSQFNSYQAAIDADTSAFQALYSPLNMVGNTLNELNAISAASRIELEALAGKLGWVGQMALSASSDIASFNMNVASIEAAVNSVNAIVSSGKSKAEFLALDAISKGANPEIVKQMLENVTTVLDANTYTIQNNTDAHIDNQMAVDDAVSPLQNLVNNLDEADAAAKRLASEGLSASKKAAADAAREFENLKSKVASMLQEGLSPDVSIADSILPRTDDINENARRLAAIANDGIGDQSWMEEFKNEVPGIFDEIVNAANPQAAAARIFQEFQLGLRPELMDKELIKQRIKDAILGEQKMDALATEIAQELSASMGISLPAALKAAQDALGVAPTGGEGAESGGAVTGVTIKPKFDLADIRSAGATAGTEFSAGMDAPGVANKFSVSFMLSMKEFYGRFYASGAASAGEYNSGFITQFKSNVPVEIVLALATLVTPEVLAAIDSRNGRSGALP